MSKKNVPFQEFFTPQRTLELTNKKGTKSKSYRLSHYNISIHNLIYMEFATEKEPDGTVNFLNRLNNHDPMACLKAIYLLVEDKTDFPTFEDFTKTFNNFSVSIADLEILIAAVMQDSIPQLRKKK